MPCDAQVFSSFTRDKFNSLVEKAVSAGVPISGDAGEAKAHGVMICWEFIESEETLTITVLSKPFYIPCAAVNAQIQAWVHPHIDKPNEITGTV